ncbi:hypothetical protein CspHIS471_0607480 [Cutaneotrichosporon sp. HIS471]|nr:hypothetical protein CspHIS471_0607480 [Cutaneotrichosporon sp. HIS471]
MTKSILNPPGSPPSPERVEEIARRVLDIDTPDQPTPEWFMPILTKFLTNNPGDDHFIIELPDPSAPARGGTGYGAVTCMEDECWSNINLSPDPEQLDGGKTNGVGTLWDYADHCRGEDHIKCRNQRLRRMGVVAPESALLSSPFTSSQAGPSRLASQIQPSSSGSAHILRDHPPNLPSMGASSSNYRGALFVDSDSDDDIEFVGRSSPRKDVVLVDDSDDGQKPSIGSSQSQSSRLKSSQPTGSSGGNSRRWIRVWSSMSLSDRRHAINQELRDLGKLPGLSSFDANRAIARRKDALRSIEGSGCLMQWTPPDPLIFQAFPNLYVHARLAETFERPKPAVGALINPAARFAASAVAGPSTSLKSPFSYEMVALSLTERATRTYLDAVNAAWQGLDKQSRLAQLINEQNVLRQAISRYEVNPQLHGIQYFLRDCFKSHARLISSDNPTWLPPSSELLKLVPELRHVVHQSLMTFLPLLRDEDDDVDPYGLSEERNRPTGPALTDYFKDALLDFQDDATVEEASKTLGLSTTSDLLPGADFTLMPHQILGVAFMMKREQRKGKGGCGGLLCDAMGLGKTIQTLALMLARDERPADYERAPQLIVAPLALLVQWKEEIETKTTKGFRVYIHHGANRLKSAAQIRNSYDIVLTTYGTLCSESGITKQKQKKKKVEEGSDDDSDYIEKKKRGPLFKIHWFRAVLDEAHNVRNRRTISARSVLQLDVLHPWILTGTPIVNSLGDVGPALEFIGAMDLSQYNEEVVKREKKQPKNASRRCQAILKPLMLRRNKDTELNGKKILELPAKTVNLAWQDFELDERAIYAAIEQRARMRVSKFLKAGTVMKNYHVVLVLLTRLRQAANHPWLLRRKPGDEGHDGDLLVDDEAFGADLGQCRNNDEDEYGRAVAILGKAAVDALAKKLEERHERLSDEDVQDDKELECCICMEPLDGSEVITPCSHLYCRACISNYFIQPVRDATGLTDEDVDAGCRSCPMCRSRLKPGQVFRCAAIFRPTVATPEVDDDDDDDVDIKPDVKPNIAADRKGKKRARSAAESFFGSLKQDQGEPEEDEQPERKRTRGNRKGKSRATSVDDDDDVEEIEAQVPPSTKLRRTLELVQGFLEEDPNTKVLIFSQFVGFLDLLSDFLKDNGIPSLGYRGSMSASARDEAVRRFRTAPGIVDPIPVMLISTKAGGVGLNLTMAHKVIMCDLAWNPATENQAIDRSHRIGQKKPVQVERLVIRDTVEDRLLSIQEHKGLLADGAMGEGPIGRLGRLTLDDIRKLFAINARDEE